MTREDSIERSPGRRHVLRWVLLGLATAGLAAGGVVVGSYVLRAHPGAKSINRAVGDFRRSYRSTVIDTSSVRLPAPGVFEFVGTGGERISFPANSQTDGATMPVSIERLAGNCFRWRIDYNEAHWQQQELCRVGDDLMLRTFQNFQRWDFGTVKVENTGTFTCDPPERYPLEAPIGTVTTGSCSGMNTAVTGRTTIASRFKIVGRVQLHVGATVVATVHIHQSDRAVGAQAGKETEDWWFEVGTGLPVRVVRSYRLDSASPLGTITYTEEGQGQLTGVQPRR